MTKSFLSNTDKIYAEYPFLEDIFPRVRVKKAQVSRWDDDFDERNIFYGNELTRLTEGPCYLLDAQGRIIIRVGGPRNFFGFLRSDNPGQTMARLGKRADDVQFATLLDRYGKMTLFKK